MVSVPSAAPLGAVQNVPQPFLSKRRKAAIIVRLLMREGADLSLHDLPESMQIDLTHEMGTLRAIDQATLQLVVQEFLDELQQVGVSFPGGLGGALEDVAHALSPTCANRIRRDAGVSVVPDPWGYLSGLENEDLRDILAAESTEIAAVVLSKLPISKSAEVLALLPADTAREISYAVSRTGVIAPHTVQSIGAALAEQAIAQPAIAFDDGPVGRLGAILNSSAADTRDEVLSGLEETDKIFAEEVKKTIFTFGDIPDRIDPRDMPKISRAVDQALLITALAAAETTVPEAAAYVLEHMSQRMAAQLRDEIQDLGEVKPKDGEVAMSTVISAIRDMEEAGELVLKTEEE